jgi:hypothetical protein
LMYPSNVLQKAVSLFALLPTMPAYFGFFRLV